MRRTNFSIILLACFTLCLLDAAVINTACAAQDKANEVPTNDPRTISGKITDVITAGGFTYAEVDTGKEKVWAAGPGETPLRKGDMVSFSTETPMHNFHSNSLGRDFPVIYFIKQIFN